MSVKDIFETFSAEALDCIFVKPHLIRKDHLPCVFYAAEVTLGVSGILIEIICLAVSCHVHSADMVACLIELLDHLFVALQIFCHSVADLNDAFYLGS